MKIKPRIAVILLNYNCEEDLFISAKQIKKQKNIELITIIIDNASNQKTINKLKLFEQKLDKNAFIGTKKEVFALINQNKLDKDKYRTFFIYNDENKGYAAGNNIGIKMADYLNVDGVLIVNPDMRFEDDKYIYKLAQTLFSKKEYYIAASRIIGLKGEEQNPWREVKFIEEFLWPLWKFKKKNYVIDYSKTKISIVPKVCGCCFMIKMNFLRKIGYFDENTFLYSEEPILSSQVKQFGGYIVFNPFIKAIHAHEKSKKGNSSQRMLLFIKSRKYYLKNYSGYNVFQLGLLYFSYYFLYLYHKIKKGIN